SGHSYRFQLTHITSRALTSRCSARWEPVCRGESPAPEVGAGTLSDDPGERTVGGAVGSRVAGRREDRVAELGNRVARAARSSHATTPRDVTGVTQPGPWSVRSNDGAHSQT